MPFSLLNSGTAYTTMFPKHSKRRAQKARSVAQIPEDPARSLVGVRNWSVPMLSHTHNHMAEASRRRAGPAINRDGPCPPAPDNGVLVQTLGEFTEGGFYSQLERDFG